MQRPADGRPLMAPFLRRDIERMLTRYELVSRQIAEESRPKRKEALNDGNTGHFPNAEKVQRLSKLWRGGRGRQLTVLVAEVISSNVRDEDEHVASFMWAFAQPLQLVATSTAIKGSARPAPSSLGKR